MDDVKLRGDVRDAQSAHTLLENETLKDALAYLEQAYIDVWRAAKTPQARDEVWYNLRGLQRFQEHLNTVVANGRLADAQIAELVRMQKREKRYG